MAERTGIDTLTPTSHDRISSSSGLSVEDSMALDVLASGSNQLMIGFVANLCYHQPRKEDKKHEHRIEVFQI